MNKKTLITIIIIFILTITLRLWQLDKIPTGISNDELNFLINAKSVYLTGKDIGGNALPFFLPKNGEFPQAELPHILMAPFVGPLDFSLFLSKYPYAVISIFQVGLLFLIVRKLLNKNYALIVALVASLNPWSIFFGRTAYEAPLAIFFYLLAFYLLLTSRNWKILLAFIPLFIGFYSYMGTKLILLPLIIIISIYCWLVINNKKYLKQYLILIALCFTLFIFFLATVGLQSTSTRVSELSTPGSAIISESVDKERRLSISTPITPIFSNKLIVWGKDSITKYFKVFSTEFLFINGEARSTFSLWYHGYFYYTDLIFLLLGYYAIMKRKKSLWLLLTGLILISPLPTIASTVGSGFAALRSALLFPLLIILIGTGILYSITLIKNKNYRLIYVSAICLIYLILLFNFINIYFFRNPIYNSEAYSLSDRLVSKYISLAQEQGQNVVFISNDPKSNFKHYIFDNNSFTRDRVSQITASFMKHQYKIDNVVFSTCTNNLEITPGDIIIVNAVEKCNKAQILKLQNSHIVPHLADGAPIFQIFNDTICGKYTLKKSPYAFTLSDFDIENHNEQKFCETFIIDPKQKHLTILLNLFYV